MFEDFYKESRKLNGYVLQIGYKPFSTVLFTEKSLMAAKEHMGLVSRKPVFRVCEKASFKQVSSATETSQQVYISYFLKSL